MTRAAAAPAARARLRIESIAVAAPAVTFVLGLITLGSKSLWYDETYTAWAIRGSWSRLWFLIEDHEGPHAVYYAVVKAWTHAAGESEWALRLPSVVAAAAAVYVVYAIGARLFDRRAAALAAAVVAVNPFIVIWSQQARSYALVLLAACVSTLALLHALARPSTYRWGLYAAASGAALTVHLFAGLVLPAHAAAVLLRRPRPPLAVPLLAFSIVGAVALGVAYEAASRADVLTEWLHEPSAADVVRGVLLVAGVGPLAVVSAALGAWTATRRGVAVWVTAFLLTWAAGPFVVAAAVSFVEPVFASRYLIVAAPPFALLTGYWLTQAARRLAVAFAAGLLTWSLVVLVFWYTAPPLEDWRRATRDVLAAARGKDVLYAPPPAVTGFEYYAGTAVAAAEPRTDRIWLLVWGSSAAKRERAASTAAGRHGYVRAQSRAVDGWLSVEEWVRR